MKNKLLLALCSAVAMICSGCLWNFFSHTPKYPDGKIVIEVDWQRDCSPYRLSGQGSVRQVFPSWCKPEFVESDQQLNKEMLLLDIYSQAMQAYWYEHCLKQYAYPLPPLPLHKYYLCGITQFKDEYGVPIDSVTGITREGEIYLSFSFICRYLVEAGPYVEQRELKVCCHELGHQVGHLEHLCDGYLMNPVHSDESCLMGQDVVAVCTGEDLLDYIHFCTACKDSLVNSDGREVLQ